MEKLGIICALENEAAGLVTAMTDKTKETINYLKFIDGKIGNTEVVVVSKAYGKVNAACASQIMILKYGVKALINTGVGGGLGQGLKPGDTVLADKLCQHDVDSSPIGDPVGLISGLYEIFIEADKDLTNRLFAAATRLGYNTRRGIIATGDQFIATEEQRRPIINRFGALACEMEGCAVAQVAKINGVPFAVLRAISDNGDGDAPADYFEFTKIAARKAVNIILSLLKE